MVNMNTTMSLTAIDKRLMMKWAIVLALLMLSQWRALTVMWCGDIILAISISRNSRPNFGDAPYQTWPNPINHDQARSIVIRPNHLGLGPIKPNWAWSGADFGNAPNFGDDLLRSKNWHFPQKCWKCQILILCEVSQQECFGEWISMTLV
jgi:hypothetical protein